MSLETFGSEVANFGDAGVTMGGYARVYSDNFILRTSVEYMPGYYVRIHYVNGEAEDIDMQVESISPYLDIAGVTYPATIDVSCFVQGKMYRNESPAYTKRIRLDSSGQIIVPIPNAPTNLRAKKRPGGKIKLDWDYYAAHEEVSPATFDVYADTGTGYALLYQVAAPVTQYITGAYAHNTDITFRVRANDGNDNVSAYTDTVTITADAEAVGDVELYQITRHI
jgi:hypothetical protein